MKNNQKLSKSDIKIAQITPQSTDSGRSMVEMLGVLAIAGVLSIAGIMGYKYAMNKYQANKIVNELNMINNQLSFVVNRDRTDELFLTLGDPYDNGTLTAANYGYSFGCGVDSYTMGPCPADEIAYYQRVDGVPKEVCQSMVQMSSNLPYLVEQQVNEVADLTGEQCIESEYGNTVVLFFEAGKSGEAGEDCPAARPVYNAESGRCEACPDATPAWNEVDKTCTTCYSMNADKPAWNRAKNACDTCYNANSKKQVWDSVSQSCVSCHSIDSLLPHWNTETQICEACPSKSLWSDTVGKCATYECRSNEDCADKGDGYYCYLYYGSNCSEYSNNPYSYFSGQCRKLSDDTWSSPTKTAYIMSKENMTWFSAERFCKAHGYRMVEFKDLNCADPISTDGPGTQYCHGTSTGDLKEDTGNKSDVIKFIASIYGGYVVWTNSAPPTDSCKVFFLALTQGYVSTYGYRYWTGGRALCLPNE